MKIKLFLLVSVLANLALVGVFVLGPSERTNATAPGASNSASVTASATATDKTSSPAQDLGGLKPEQKLQLNQVWGTLHTKDLKLLVERLKAAGFPMDLIRTIVTKEISDHYREQRKMIMGGDVQPYWATKRNSGMFDTGKLMKLSREMNEEMKSVLGSDMYSGNEDMSYYMRRQYGNIPQEKALSIQRLQSDYAEMRMQIQSEAANVMFPEDKAKMAVLEKEQRADLEALLSPEELKEYDMRNSISANTIRSRYAGFDFTQEEFNQIYEAQKAFDDKYTPNYYYGGGSSFMDSTTMKARSEAEQATQNAIKQVLGEARYKELERSSDTSYRTASQIAERLQLPAQNAVAVYDLKKSTEEQQKAIMANRSTSFEAKQQAIQNLVTDTNAKLQQYLTQKGYDAYKANSAGYWVQNMDRMSKMRPPSTPARSNGGP